MSDIQHIKGNIAHIKRNDETLLQQITDLVEYVDDYIEFDGDRIWLNKECGYIIINNELYRINEMYEPEMDCFAEIKYKDDNTVDFNIRFHDGGGDIEFYLSEAFDEDGGAER